MPNFQLHSIRTHHVLTALLCAAGVVLSAYLVHGHFHAPVAMRSPINVESFLAVAAVVLLSIRSTQSVRQQQSTNAGANLLPLGALLIVGVLVFGPFVSTPLVYDSYTHLALAPHYSWSTFVNEFTRHPQAGDFFFRPIGDLSFWLDYACAGMSPFRWHLWNLAIHLANVVLVFQLSLAVRFSRWAAFVAALLFCVHGSRPETVLWMAARYDLLSVFFGLGTLLVVAEYATAKGGNYQLCIAAFLCILSLLSKEATFTVSLLVLLFALPLPEVRRRLIKAAAVLGGVTAAVLVHRFWLLHGIGGYGAQYGSPEILRHAPLHTLKALALREWALLFFPVNWSEALGPLLTLFFISGLFLFIYCISRARVSRRLLFFAIAWTVVSSLPVQHLLLLSQDLSGARVLYWPGVGFALIFAVVATAADSIAAFAGLACILLVHTAILEHNLSVWRRISREASRVCRASAEALGPDPSPAAVYGLPATEDGVFFLKNGFPECVAANSPYNAPLGSLRIVVDPGSLPPGYQVYRWEAVKHRISRIDGAQ